MKMIFYKAGDKNVMHHPVPKEWTDEKIDERIRKFNSGETNPDGKTAFALEIQDGSVEAYLLECLEKRIALCGTRSKRPRTPSRRRGTVWIAW